MKKYLFILLLLPLLCVGVEVSDTDAVASVSSTRCSGKIVKVGMSSGQVIRHCGEPNAIVEQGSTTTGRHSSKATGFRGGVKIKGRFKSRTVNSYLYEYYFPGKLPVVFTIVGGQVKKIEIGRR